MRTLYLSLATVTVLLMAIPAHAYPNLNAATGLLAVPTASIVTAGNFVVGADVLSNDDATFNGRIIYGLTPQLEIGAGFVSGEDTATGVSAKLALAGTIAGFHPAIGISVINGNDNAISDGTQVYLVGSKVLSDTRHGAGTLIGTLGVNFTDIDTASAVRPFVGAQLRLGDRTELDGEYVLSTGNFNRSIHSIFVRHVLNETWTIQTGFTNAVGFTGSAHNNFFMGTAYSWGHTAR